jgi:hypothetical protein
MRRCWARTGWPKPSCAQAQQGRLRGRRSTGRPCDCCDIWHGEPVLCRWLRPVDLWPTSGFVRIRTNRFSCVTSARIGRSCLGASHPPGSRSDPPPPRGSKARPVRFPPFFRCGPFFCWNSCIPIRRHRVRQRQRLLPTAHFARSLGCAHRGRRIAAGGRMVATWLRRRRERVAPASPSTDSR